MLIYCYVIEDESTKQNFGEFISKLLNEEINNEEFQQKLQSYHQAIQKATTLASTN
jgi:hypothetical protein